MDFLQIFDDVEDLGDQVDQAVPGELHRGSDEEHRVKVERQLKHVSSALVQTSARDLELARADPAFVRTKRLGLSGRHGGARAKALSWHMHFCKSYRKARHTEASILDALIQLQHKVRTGKSAATFVAKRVKRNKYLKAKNSLVLQAKLKCQTHSNRFARRFGMADFLEVAFGEKNGQSKNRFLLEGQIAKHVGASRETTSLMRTSVAGSVMTKQMHVLARVLLLCRNNPPVCTATRHAWDETGQDIQVPWISFKTFKSFAFPTPNDLSFGC